MSEQRQSSTASQGRPLISVHEAAAYLKIAVWTLRHWVGQRKIPFVKLGRLVRFRQADLDAYVSKHIFRSSDGK